MLFCVGAVTLNTVAAQRERFARIADFLIAPRPVLDALNDKETVHARAQSLGIPVPRQYDGVPPERYPVVIKPHCGEKFGLKAADRYAVADTPEAYAQILARMQRYDPSPIVQDKIAGPGIGVSLLLDRDGRMISALCHRRIREYPITGGPSTCCESFYDAALIDRAYRLLHSFGFTGMAMVEFKGDCLLEVNPRVWGSFPMTEAAQSPLVAHYARAAAGERVAARRAALSARRAHRRVPAQHCRPVHGEGGPALPGRQPRVLGLSEKQPVCARVISAQRGASAHGGQTRPAHSFRALAGRAHGP